MPIYQIRYELREESFPGVRQHIPQIRTFRARDEAECKRRADKQWKEINKYGNCSFHALEEIPKEIKWKPE